MKTPFLKQALLGFLFAGMVAAHAQGTATGTSGGGRSAASDEQTGVTSSAAETPVITNDPAAMRGRGDALPSIRNNTPQPRPEATATPTTPPSRPPQVTRPAGAPREPLPTEFQRFVLESTGSRLSLFGFSFFADAPRTFSPIDRAPVPADYLVGPGDEVLIRAWGSIDVDYRAVVDRSGMINLPRIGSFRVAGLRSQDLEPFLHERVGRVFKNFSLSASLGQLRAIQVFVVGHAAAPGTYTVSSLSTLINVVFASGGPAGNGSLRKVTLRRENRVVSEIDVYDFIVNGNRQGDVQLAAGDVIVYGAAGPRVALIGSSDTPAIYELKPAGESVHDLLGYSGGLRAATDQLRAQLERIDPAQPKSPRSVQRVSLADPQSLRLQDGDVLTLLRADGSFRNAVTLRGNVARPLRHPWKDGMRVSELIPDRDALLTADYYQRKNRLVQYLDDKGEMTGTSVGELRNIVDEPSWEYAVIERLNPKTLSMELIPFHLGRAVLAREASDDLLLEPGDVVTVFSRRSITGPVARRTRLVRIEGEVATPGVYQVRPGESLQALIKRAGGISDDAYLFGVDFSREETRRKQRESLDEAVRRLESQLSNAAANQTVNFGAGDVQSAALRRQAQLDAQRAQVSRLRELQPTGRIALELSPTVQSLDELPDIALEDGDRILVPNRPSFVFVVGAVSNSNGLLWRRGRTLKQYLDLAGVEADADDSNIFVVRADGTVRHSARQGFFSSLEDMELMPGDAVVVPGKSDRETFWNAFVRGLKDWSQILSQFGLTAVAIDTLRR